MTKKEDFICPFIAHVKQLFVLNIGSHDLYSIVCKSL